MMAMALASVPPVLSPSRLKPPQPRPATLTVSSVRPSVVYSMRTFSPVGTKASAWQNVLPVEAASLRAPGASGAFAPPGCRRQSVLDRCHLRQQLPRLHHVGGCGTVAKLLRHACKQPTPYIRLAAAL